MPAQDPAILGRLHWQETSVYHKIRQVTLIALRLMVLQGHHRGVITTRIILVIQTMEVHLMKLTYRVALGIVILNLILQTQRVLSEALELYILATRTTVSD